MVLPVPVGICAGMSRYQACNNLLYVGDYTAVPGRACALAFIGDNPAHLQETMSFGVQSMFELAHILVLLGIYVVIWEVYGEPFQDKFHSALLCLVTSSLYSLCTICSKLRRAVAPVHMESH